MSDDRVKTLQVKRTSRLSGFYRQSPERRRARLVEARWVAPDEVESLAGLAGFDEACADAMVENVIGIHGLPLGVALNFVVDGRERLVPMAVEEPSIIAAASYAARLCAEAGGFTVEADPPITTAQVELLDVPSLEEARAALHAHRAFLLAEADALIPAMCERGGGTREIEVRVLDATTLVVHLHIDTRDAMGANCVNSVAEGMAPRLAELTGARPGLKILTNLADRRKVRVRARVPASALVSEGFPDGGAVRDGILAAHRFAELDPYRAVTHNKGVMNGVDAVLVACGNDWRAVEAGAHAWAARSGTYGPLTTWRAGGDGVLEGELFMPLATSTAGGAARTHPGVKRALKLAGVSGALDLAGLAGAAGLATNLAALKALSTEGIQKGHMALHARRVAAEAGAYGELIEIVAERLSRERVYRPERAREILAAEVARRKGVGG
ncbi:hydroxymethylglutaryl-CoA reductase, degradative [Myxococcus sp. RHSTA-1-4]|uniref:hydroxymethylglutaryl-CoA reductase, degradative n=1 Tax=Myxococcus sp. RHSTA-1-4 TaxID=2874601 RepID=UPI001CBD3B3D|nr:hydroxymethylglutaryl-CoA reductase, degradative [Myxococcus sp. RHSTA-1-4]MBZ4415462.1 hydroxymethylglutaryl-CoA reductase, degradative [Myxococcus sp. RHSTA-1-4]